jgi:hypothetical protein
MSSRTAHLLVSLSALAWIAPVQAAEDDIARTPGGLPDLSGNYDISTLTPFERDPRFGDRRAFSAEEARDIRQRNATLTETANAPSDPDREAPPVGGNVGGYNFFFIDRGTAPVRVDGEYRTSLLVEPENGRLPPLTERGRARREGMYSFWGKNSGEAWWLGAEVGPYDHPEYLSVGDRCVFHFEATIPARPRLYNNLKTIVQTPGHVMILSEWMHHARVVRLGEKGAIAHRPPEFRTRAGDSVGWWEGDTLVVETTNFLEEDWVTLSVDGNASPTSDQRVIERFSPRPGGDLVYEFTVESSDFTAPFRGEYTWPATTDRLYEYACHEGNYALGNILRGARLLEQEAAATAGRR